MFYCAQTHTLISDNSEKITINIHDPTLLLSIPPHKMYCT